jgi:transcriptional regulator with XRE-family HTH domain
MAPTSYTEVLARNIRATRSRRGLSQADVVERMRALGFTAWHRPTLGNIERGSRGVRAEELVGLARALEVTMSRLLEPQPEDKQVELPNGEPFSVRSVRMLVAEGNDHAILWKGNVPLRREGWAGWEGDPDAPDAVKAAWRQADEERPDA